MSDVEALQSTLDRECRRQLRHAVIAEGLPFDVPQEITSAFIGPGWGFHETIDVLPCSAQELVAVHMFVPAIVRDNAPSAKGSRRDVRSQICTPGLAMFDNVRPSAALAQSA